jgi:iron complex outermembrane receptor protein
MVGLTGLSMAQNASIEGKVTDANGSPLLGASVYLEGTYLGTTTDLDGNYVLIGLNPGKYLVTAKFIGYEKTTQEIRLAGEKASLDFKLPTTVFQADEFVVEGTRANELTPMAVQDISKEEIEARNVGQDIPYILDMATSVVSTSDAGAGVGYTGMRIRGSDATRINVTVNGVPLNDAESHGVFWVNMPDFASNTNSIQIQRGVGTSTNGAGAFGASVNLSTTELNAEAYGEYEGGYGSFNTQRHSIRFGSGLVNDKFAFDGRLSSITSDGFIDRATSDLRSYYFSAGYYGKKSTLKFITFNGTERTYQAWNGIPKSMLDSTRTYNAYDYPDEVDNYGQNHFQLHYTQAISGNLNFSGALHYTKGAGYFEQYKGDRYNADLNFGAKEDLADYGLRYPVIGGEIIRESNLVRRRWLDNDFYGFTYNFSYRKNRLYAILGGGYNEYVGDHFGEVIWAEFASNGDIYHRYYDNTATKTDFNTYLKANYSLLDNLNLFADLQVRAIGYEASGFDQGSTLIDVDQNMLFFNPKAGFTLDLDRRQQVYGSFAVANREPNRNDFVDADPGTTPISEQLFDYELGFRRSTRDYAFTVNAYFMDYINQLVLTGELNDVGAPIRSNIANSYRAGIEAEFGWQITKKLDWRINATYSQNKIAEWTEYVDNWADETDRKVVAHENTDIAFSPDWIAGSVLRYTHKGLFLSGDKSDRIELMYFQKYVGEQFIDNTQSDERKLDAYTLGDIRVDYTLENVLFKQFTAYVLIRNVFDVEYESNAWVYRYHDGMDFQELNGYFPQAGINFMAGLRVSF